MTIKRILSDNPNGINFKKKGLTYQPAYFKTGYFVALTDNQIQPENYRQAINQIKKLADQLQLKTYFFGWWLDPKTGLGYLDLSLHVENKAEALTIARAFNQKAIFDCLKLNSVYV